MFLCLGIVAFIAIRGSDGQEPCTTVFQTPGTCVSIYECSPLLTLLRYSRSLPSEEVLTLRNFQCGHQGNTPKVCCPESTKMLSALRMPSTPQSGPAVVPGPPDVTNHPNLRLLPNNNCGALTEGRIIKGNKTGLFEFPWMALIGYNVYGNGTDFRCGGTLINKRYVLTAAHCVTGLIPGFVLAGVRLGDHDLSKETDCEIQDGETTVCADKYQNFFIEHFHVHGGYEPKKHKNDIALIRMDADANLEPFNVRPICLPIGNSAMMTSKKVIVTGWGKTEHGVRSTDLLKVRLELVASDKCAEIYKRNGIEVSYKQLCAASDKRMDSCTGDSGGPLQYPNAVEGTPKYVQYGVVSFGPEICGAPGYPGVYTKVAYYMDWILDTITD